jgi:putative ABC transport system substrate-binding protein
MRRRELITAAAGLAVAKPFVSSAQPKPSRPIVVLLTTGSVPPELRAEIVAGIGELGFVESRDFDIAHLAAEGDFSRVPALIAETIALSPTVIVSSTTGLTVELKRATGSIPIVNPTIADPIGLGFAASLARPGGNVTGMMSTSASGGKQVELLLQIAPHITKLGILLNPRNAGNTAGFPRLRDEIAALPVTLVRVEAQTRAEIAPAFQELARQAVQGLMVFQDPLFNKEAKMIADLALADGCQRLTGSAFCLTPAA